MEDSDEQGRRIVEGYVGQLATVEDIEGLWRTMNNNGG
jgi:hypothetical protein